MRQFILMASLLFVTGCATNANKNNYGDYYLVKEDGVYWSRFVRLTQKRVDLKVDTIDPSSFSMLSNPWYAKDKTYVYLKAVPIPQADPFTFSLISENVGKDNNYVFLKGEVIPNADPGSFQVINDKLIDTYAKDKNSYFFNLKKFQPCDEASLTFEKGFIQTWAKDKLCIFYNGTKIEGADAPTHKMLILGYSKDKNRVYHGEKELSGANLATFDIIDGMAKDKNNCYKQGLISPCPGSSRKLSEMTEKELDDSASDMAMNMFQSDQDKKHAALLAIPKTSAAVVKKYRDQVLTPNDVKNINLGNLKPGYTYTLNNKVGASVTEFYPRANAITYKLRSINNDTAEFDVIHPRNFGYLTQTNQLNGTIRSAPYLSNYPFSRIYYPQGNCEFQIGTCEYTTKANATTSPVTFKQIGNFTAGVWTYYTQTQTGKQQVNIYIYDKNGFPLYMTSYVENSLTYEYERAE
ncbi:MAG: hypothetical protein B0W54_09165 [Cellvibrio sp. 79]|nr:MAG: hypothetical protein B0W54_09165 [Cellvibrio sp. 79]